MSELKQKLLNKTATLLGICGPAAGGGEGEGGLLRDWL